MKTGVLKMTGWRMAFGAACLLAFGAAGCGGEAARTEAAGSPSTIFRNTEVVQGVLSSAASLCVQAAAGSVDLGGTAALASLEEGVGCRPGSLRKLECPEGGSITVSFAFCEENPSAESSELLSEAAPNSTN